MEQAVNVFNKGLQMDTNPMVQGTDTLSNALNATFVTMNGNEVILQNDMGNRKVDNAYLPSGYEPVGIKEYGGIIYLALYNPITNRSQIGSFPSPERKMGIENPDLNNSISSLDSLFKGTESKEGITFLQNENGYLLPLTSNTSLYPGDKFTVYCPDLWIRNFGKNNLSNFDNITGDKITSPKNKQYTLSLGILNSQNEFVDITSSLSRWNNNTQIDTLDNKSNLYKFNSGYFIASDIPEGLDLSDYTQKDSILLQERQKAALNTYAYKLVGPLYLKVIHNHIQNFSFYFDNTKNVDGIVTFDIVGNITYNCPDGVSTKSNEDDDNYDSYYTGTVTSLLNGFDLFINNGTQYNKKNNTTVTYGKSTYQDGIYSVQITKSYTIDMSNQQSTLINYYLCVGKEQNYYISSLSTKGILDISSFNDGTIKLNAWRFLNKDGVAYFTYGINANITEQRTATFKFYEDGSSILRHTEEVPLRTGIGNFSFDIPKEKTLYKVVIEGIEYEREIPGGAEIIREQNRFYLSTDLFNSCYYSASKDFVNDYIIFQDSSQYIYNISTIEQSIKDKKLTISVDYDPNITISKTKDDPTISGQYYVMSDSSTSPGPLKLTYDTKYNINIKASPKVVYNDSLYPSYINLSSYYNETASRIKFTKINASEIQDKIKILGSNPELLNKSDLVNIDLNFGEYSVNEFKTSKLYTYNIKQIYKTDPVKTSVTILNDFKCLEDLVKGSDLSSVISQPWIAVGAFYEGDKGGKSPKLSVKSTKNTQQQITGYKHQEEYDWTGWDTGYHAGSNNWYTYNFSEYTTNFINLLNTNNGNNIFAGGIFPTAHTHNDHDTYSGLSTSSTTSRNPAQKSILRIWAKGANGKWGILLTDEISTITSDDRPYVTLSDDVLASKINTALKSKGWDFYYSSNSSSSGITKTAWFKNNNNYAYPDDADINIPAIYNVTLSTFSTIPQTGKIIQFNIEGVSQIVGQADLDFDFSESFNDQVQDIIASDGQMPAYCESLGTSVDNQGNTLRGDALYKKNNFGKLEEYSNNQISFITKGTRKYPIFTINSSGRDKCQVAWEEKEGHTHVRISFDTVPVINSI